MEKWMGWSEVQVELFDILGRVCSGLGETEASGIVNSIKHGDQNGTGGKAFVEQLAELKKRAARVENLEREMIGLKEALKRLRPKLDKGPRSSISLKATSFEDPRERTASPPHRESVILRSPSGYSEPPGENYKALVVKHNALVTNHKELLAARKELEDQLRAKKRLLKDWMKYADSLEKKVGRQENLRLMNTLSESKNPVFSSLNPSQHVASGLPGDLAEEISAGDMIGSMPKSMYPNSNTTLSASRDYLGGSGLCSKISDVRHDAELTRTRSPVLLELPKHSHVSKSRLNSECSTILPNLLTKDTNNLNNPDGVPEEQKLGQLLHSHRSSSTDEGNAVAPLSVDKSQHSIPPSAVKADSVSDVPIVISSRTVRKRKPQVDARPGEFTKVKMEVLTSSPIGFAGVLSLQACESLDLDDIGEKHPTPKKSRQILKTSSPHTRQEQSYKLQMESLSSLQPANSNKQILPRTSGKERQLKRRRLDDGIVGAKILADDGEDEVVMEEANIKPLVKLPADPGEPEGRLGGLLENPSAKSQVLTPTRRLFISTAMPSQGTGGGLKKRFLRSSASAAHQGSSTTYSTPLNKLQNAAASDSKGGTSRKRATNSFRDNLNTDRNANGDERFRTRPLRHLGIEHFKVNPSFNQGYEFAFTDVVRGREQRSCLPGCTKPECCGNKLRKFVELTRKVNVKQTRSQKQEDERLLNDYMGDNRSKLRKMTELEKEELLVQARTRALAQKAGRHRHAYERRRSPPGFWRTDFPTTQEMEADRVEAAQLERELVQQRYEEAMRPGGRWMFRDE